jgi:hypothetical protein
MTPEEAASLSGRAVGKTLISASGKPLGFGGVYFDENGEGQCVVIAYFYGGPNNFFMRKYLPLALRGFRDTCQILIGMGIEKVYAIADSNIPEADKFIKWMNGVQVGEEENGPIYVLPLAKLPIISRTTSV